MIDYASKDDRLGKEEKKPSKFMANIFWTFLCFGLAINLLVELSNGAPNVY